MRREQEDGCRTRGERTVARLERDEPHEQRGRDQRVKFATATTPPRVDEREQADRAPGQREQREEPQAVAAHRRVTAARDVAVEGRVPPEQPLIERDRPVRDAQVVGNMARGTERGEHEEP